MFIFAKFKGISYTTRDRKGAKIPAVEKRPPVPPKTPPRHPAIVALSEAPSRWKEKDRDAINAQRKRPRHPVRKASNLSHVTFAYESISRSTSNLSQATSISPSLSRSNSSSSLRSSRSSASSVPSLGSETKGSYGFRTYNKHPSPNVNSLTTSNRNPPKLPSKISSSSSSLTSSGSVSPPSLSSSSVPKSSSQMPHGSESHIPKARPSPKGLPELLELSHAHNRKYKVRESRSLPQLNSSPQRKGGGVTVTVTPLAKGQRGRRGNPIATC